MRKVGKYFGVLFLWMAMLVIVGHGVIPHHHHASVIACDTGCTSDEAAGQTNPLVEDASSTITHHCESSHNPVGCHACHFKTEATTPLSKVFIGHLCCPCSPILVIISPTTTKTYYDSYQIHYSFEFLSFKTSRGPPVIA